MSGEECFFFKDALDMALLFRYIFHCLKCVLEDCRVYIVFMRLVVFDKTSSFFAHTNGHLTVRYKELHSVPKRRGIICLDDEPALPIFEQLSWSTLVRDDDRKTGCLRLEDDVPECVSRAGENEHISRGVGL